MLSYGSCDWQLLGSVLVLIGSSRQAWSELRAWHKELDSTLQLALEIVKEHQRAEITAQLAQLRGAKRLAKQRELNRLARRELERRGMELLSPAEQELLEISIRAAVSWLLIVLGSLALLISAALAVFS